MIITPTLQNKLELNCTSGYGDDNEVPQIIPVKKNWPLIVHVLSGRESLLTFMTPLGKMEPDQHRLQFTCGIVIMSDVDGNICHASSTAHTETQHIGHVPVLR